MIMALAILSRGPIWVAVRRLLSRPRRSPAEQAARLLSLPSLRSAIVGRGQRAVFDMFGPPQAAAGGLPPVWYYPIHATDRLAMAISFDDDRAVDVEFFHTP